MELYTSGKYAVIIYGKIIFLERFIIVVEEKKYFDVLIVILYIVNILLSSPSYCF